MQPAGYVYRTASVPLVKRAHTDPTAWLGWIPNVMHVIARLAKGERIVSVYPILDGKEYEALIEAPKAFPRRAQVDLSQLSNAELADLVTNMAAVTPGVRLSAAKDPKFSEVTFDSEYEPTCWYAVSPGNSFVYRLTCEYSCHNGASYGLEQKMLDGDMSRAALLGLVSRLKALALKACPKMPVDEEMTPAQQQACSDDECDDCP
jgi:hypothetical protein